MLNVALFGHLRLSCDGTNLRFAVRPKVAPLLAYLLLNGSQPISRDVLAFALWPDEPEEAARGNLRRHLHYLREALPSSRTPWLIADARRVRWNPAARVTVDVADFERFAADSATLEKAVDLYGELLQGYEDEWLAGPRERLHSRYVQSLWELVQRARGRRNRTAASDYLGRILADDPWREDAVRALMAVRCEGGDHSSALQLCAEFEQRLKREMGAALMPETTALRHAIERGHPLPAIPTTPAPHTATIASTDLPFEGRDAELAELRVLWERTAAGSGGFALVLGEAGIGKTRLASEFALSVEATGGRVFWGTTSAPETIPYQALIEAARASLGFVDLTPLSPYDLDVLARLVPELQEAESAKDPGDAPDSARLFDVVGKLFIELGRKRPALFVFEDLHAAGPATIAMLEHLIQHCRQAPIVILATLREEEPHTADTLGRLRRPRDGPPPSIIPLAPLSECAVAAIVAQSLGTSADARRVAARASGHPLFLTQLLYAAADVPDQPIDALPTRLRETIDARSRRLSEPARFLLGAAAVVGNAFDLEVVAETVGWSESRLASAIDELIARRVIRQTSSARSFEYEFAHTLIASVAYESVAERERRHWHRRAGRAAERWYATRLTELAGFVARHFDLGGEGESAAALYVAAAKAAASTFANDEALAYARRALDLRPSSESDRYDALCVIEEVLGILGRRAEQEACLRDLEHVAQGFGDPECMREVLRRRGSFHRYLSEYDGARFALERLHLLALGNARWEAIALRDESALLYNSGSLAEAYEVGARAVTRASAADDAVVLISALTLQADIAASLGRREEAVTCLQRATEAAERMGSVYLLMRALYAEVTVLTHFQAWSSVVQRGPGLLELTAKVGCRDVAAAVHTILGSALGVIFEVGGARQHLYSAIELYQRCDRSGLLTAYNDLATVELEVGRVENAQSALDELRAVDGEAPSLYGNACTLLIACEIATQRAELTTAVKLAEDAVAAAAARNHDLFEGEALRSKGVSLRTIGHTTDAVPPLERCLAIFRHLKLEESAKRAAAELSLACALAGDSARASALIDETLASCELGPAESPQVLWPLSQALAVTGRAAQARAILCKAHSAFETRRRQLRNRRDKAAFSQIPANAELERAYASLAAHPLEQDASAGTPPARRDLKTRTSDRHRPPAHSP